MRGTIDATTLWQLIPELCKVSLDYDFFDLK
jgi:hypothetical protein